MSSAEQNPPPAKSSRSAGITAGRGPHPAASPFDKCVSEHLGVTAFEVYQVELPPGRTTERHTHLDDQAEDAYTVIRGGWLVVYRRRGACTRSPTTDRSAT